MQDSLILSEEKLNSLIEVVAYVGFTVYKVLIVFMVETIYH